MEQHGKTKSKGDKRNYIEHEGQKFGFCLSTGDKIVCRQFYEDYDGVITVENNSGNIYILLRDNMKISKSANRIQPKTGLSAYSADGDYADATLTNFRIL